MHAITLANSTNSLRYRSISLSLHLVFQLVTRYFTFSHTFLNGQLTRRTIIILTHSTLAL